MVTTPQVHDFVVSIKNFFGVSSGIYIKNYPTMKTEKSLQMGT